MIGPIEGLKDYFRREFSPEKLKWDQIAEDEKKGRGCPKCGRFGFYIHLPTSIREYWWGVYRCKGCKTEYRPKFTKGNMLFLLLMAFFYFNYFGRAGFSFKSYLAMIIGFAFALGVNYAYARMSKKTATTVALAVGLGWLLAIVEVVFAHHGEGVANANPKDIAYLLGSTVGFTFGGGGFLGIIPGVQRSFEEFFDLILREYKSKAEEIAHERDRPAWSLMNRPSTDHEWDETSQSWVLKEGQTPYTGDRPEWSLMNRPGPDYDWDEATQSWVHKDNLRSKEMEAEGYEYDPYQDAWRKPPPKIEKPQVKSEIGDASRTDLKPGWISYDESTESLDKRFKELEQAERDAIDQYKRIPEEIDKARESGDKWLEEQWRQRLEKARKNVRDVQGMKNDLVGRVDERAQRAIDLERKIHKGIRQHYRDIRDEMWDQVYAIYESITDPETHPMDPDFVKTMKDAWEARERVRKDLEMAPELDKRHREAFDELRDLRDQIGEARKNGDTQLEQRLREQAEPLKNDLRQIADKLNQIHEHKRQWEIKASQANLSAYRKSTEMVLSGTQVPETAKVVNNYIDLYRRQNIPGRHGHDLTGRDTDWTYRETVGEKTSGPRTLTKTEMDLDADHFQRASEGCKKVANWTSANTPENAKKATIDCLEDYQAKLQQKYAPPDLKKEWTADVDRYRTKPLFEDMASEANKRGLMVRDGDSLRPVRPDDFGRVSSKKDPGMDLDIKYNEMIDPKTGKSVRFNEVQDIANQSCKNLNFDAEKQGITVVGGAKGSKHPEAFPVKEGATADDMYKPEHVRRFDKADAEQAYRVSEYKGDEAQRLSPADRLTERCRGSIKDYDRVTEKLMEAHPGAKKPFSDEAMNVMRQVGDGTLPPGTGNQKFRELTGMNLEDGRRKINSLQESVVKLDSRKGLGPISTDVPSGTGGADVPPKGPISPGDKLPRGPGSRGAVPPEEAHYTGSEAEPRAAGKSKPWPTDRSSYSLRDEMEAERQKLEPWQRDVLEQRDKMKLESQREALKEKFGPDDDVAEMVKKDPSPRQMKAPQHGETARKLSEGEKVDFSGKDVDPMRMKSGEKPEGFKVHLEREAEDLKKALDKDPNLQEWNARWEEAHKNAQFRNFKDLYNEHEQNMKSEGLWGDSKDPSFQAELGKRIASDPRKLYNQRMQDYYQDELRAQGIGSKEESWILMAKNQAKDGLRSEGPLPGDIGPPSGGRIGQPSSVDPGPQHEIKTGVMNGTNLPLGGPEVQPDSVVRNSFSKKADDFVLNPEDLNGK